MHVLIYFPCVDIRNPNLCVVSSFTTTFNFHFFLEHIKKPTQHVHRLSAVVAIIEVIPFFPLGG